MKVQNHKRYSVYRSTGTAMIGGLCLLGALSLNPDPAKGIGFKAGLRQDSREQNGRDLDGQQGARLRTGSGVGYRVEERSDLPDALLSPIDRASGVKDGDSREAENRAEGPVRLARFAYVSGKVQWRINDSEEWANATVNMPMREGAQVWVNDGGRAEVQFDDGSVLRLGTGALVTLKTLYSDAQGEFTQLTIKEGLATLRSRNSASVYQVDTPLFSTKLTGNAQARYGVADGSEVAVQRGNLIFEAGKGSITLHTSDYLALDDANSPLDVRKVPGTDNWDNWNGERNRLIDRPSPTKEHLPSNIGIVAENLDDYGDWREDPKYGWIWIPTHQSADWRPYYDGNWAWVEPFGWTWVGNEPWGWAPYHYGTWVSSGFGWAWCPGPAVQYWSPAVVSFTVCGPDVAWAPLCPWEVHYPGLFEVGFYGRHWGLGFSIGCAAVYSPVAGGYCVGRRFYEGRHPTPLTGRPHISGLADAQGIGGHHGGNSFVPYNASHVAGATVAHASAFGKRAEYRPVRTADASLFTRGQAVTVGAGVRTVAGPASIAPTKESWATARVSGEGPRATVLNRPTFTGALPAKVQAQGQAQSRSTVQINAQTNVGSRIQPDAQSNAQIGVRSRVQRAGTNSVQGVGSLSNLERARAAVAGTGSTHSATATGQSLRGDRPMTGGASSGNFRMPSSVGQSRLMSGAEAARQARATLGTNGGRYSDGRYSSNLPSNRSFGGGVAPRSLENRNLGSSGYPAGAAHSNGMSGGYRGGAPGVPSSGYRPSGGTSVNPGAARTSGGFGGGGRASGSPQGGRSR